MHFMGFFPCIFILSSSYSSFFDVIAVRMLLVSHYSWFRLRILLPSMPPRYRDNVISAIGLGHGTVDQAKADIFAPYSRLEPDSAK